MTSVQESTLDNTTWVLYCIRNVYNYNYRKICAEMFGVQLDFVIIVPLLLIVCTQVNWTKNRL